MIENLEDPKGYPLREWVVFVQKSRVASKIILKAYVNKISINNKSSTCVTLRRN